MIETIVLNYLLSKTLSVGTHIGLEVDINPPQKYIVLEKTGSGRSNHINRATIAIQSICRTSLADAADLNEEVKEAMDAITELPEVFSCDLNSDYNFTNTQTKEYRYQAVFDIYY